MYFEVMNVKNKETDLFFEFPVGSLIYLIAVFMPRVKFGNQLICLQNKNYEDDKYNFLINIKSTDEWEDYKYLDYRDIISENILKPMKGLRVVNNYQEEKVTFKNLKLDSQIHNIRNSSFLFEIVLEGEQPNYKNINKMQFSKLTTDYCNIAGYYPECPFNEDGNRITFCLNWRRTNEIGRRCETLLKQKYLINQSIKKFCNIYKDNQDCACYNRNYSQEYNIQKINKIGHDYCWYDKCRNDDYLIIDKNVVVDCGNNTSCFIDGNEFDNVKKCNTFMTQKSNLSLKQDEKDLKTWKKKDDDDNIFEISKFFMILIISSLIAIITILIFITVIFYYIQRQLIINNKEINEIIKQ